MKKIIFNILFVAFTYNLSGCDCDFYYRSTNYLAYESIFVCSIEASYENETDDLSKLKYGINVIEQIKGSTLDTLFTGYLCGLKYYVGDTVIVYANNNSNLNWTETGLCYGNRIINRSNFRDSKQKERFEIRKSLSHFELEMLRMYKKHFKTKKYSNIPMFKNRYITSRRGENENFIRGLFNISIIKSKARIVHVKIQLDDKGKVKRMKFLNRAPRKIRKSIRKYLRKGEWINDLHERKWINNQKGKSENKIIESFIYPGIGIEYIQKG